METSMPETGSTQESAQPEPVDCSPALSAEQAYIKVVNALMDRAAEDGNVPLLADVFAWALGRVIVTYGTPAVGDIIRRLGAHICDLDARDRARTEAEQARKEGLHPH